MGCFPQDAGSGQCFNLPGKLWTQLQCCSKHWHKAELSTALSQGRHKAGSGTELKTGLVFKSMAMCFYLQVILLISFSWNSLGICFLCSILRTPMQKLGSHPERMLQSKHIEPTEHHSLWEGPSTRLSGDLELKSPKALEHGGQVEPCLLLKPTLMELITIPLPLS